MDVIDTTLRDGEVGAPGTVFVAGKPTGPRALRYLLAERGISLEEKRLGELLELVRRTAEGAKRELTGLELEELHRRMGTLTEGLGCDTVLRAIARATTQPTSVRPKKV